MRARFVSLAIVSLFACAALAAPKAAWVNGGSNTGLFGYDWASAGVRGLNLAGGPQSMRRDFEKLKAHRAEIADGACVLFVLCPFTSILPESYDLRPSETNNALLAFDGVPKASRLDRYRDTLVAVWKKEFKIRSFDDPMTPENRAAYDKMVVFAKGAVAWCRAEKLKPVFVFPPAAPCFDSAFSDGFFKAYVTDFVSAVAPDAPFLNYWKSPDFRDNRLFANALFLNKTGRARLTARTIAELQTSSLLLLPSPAKAGIVADPYRAVDAKWPTHELKGRSWRYLLDPQAFSLSGLKEEAFVRDAGVYPIVPPSLLRDARADNLFGFSDDPNEKKFVVSEPPIPAEVKARLKDYPFQFYEASRCHLNVRHEECDLRVYDRFVAEYPETYLGCTFGEWNSRVIYFLPRKQTAHYKDFVRAFPLPWHRDKLYHNYLDYWDIAAGQKGPRVVGLSGPCNLAALGCERGSTLASIEITCERTWRELMMFTAGAGRQFNVPLEYYLAFFRGGYTCCSTPGAGPIFGEDWGIAPNLAYRTVMIGYYRGCNYQLFECFPSGFVKEVENDDSRSARVSRAAEDGTGKKKVVLTGNGRAAKRAYDFIRSPAGARGAWYAPILLLVDRAHGHDGLSGDPSVVTGHGPFANEFSPTLADQFLTDLLTLIGNNTRLPAEQIPPKLRDKSKPIAEYQFGLYNSPFADIFDVAIANPVTPGKELRADQLAKYPVVLCAGGIQWDEALVAKLADYVEQGGTFVYPQGELSRVKKSGRGNVVAMPREPQAMKGMLRQLQKEVLPCSYAGHCETVWNVMPDGSWRVCVVNNAGVEKPPKGTVETFHDEYAKTVTFDLPAGATARELVTGEVTSKIHLPPGEVRVLEIKGLEKHSVSRSARDSRAADGRARSMSAPPLEFSLDFKPHGKQNELCYIREEWETDELTIEVMAKPKPIEYWREMWTKDKHPLQGGVFGACGFGYTMFTMIWSNGDWWMRRGDRRTSWIHGPKADPNRFTKLAITLKDSYLHFFVDDREVFGEAGPTYWPKKTSKDLFNGLFGFHRGSDSFQDSANHSFLGEAKDYHAYSKAIYPLKYEVEKPSGGDDTATIQKTIDAAVEKTGEVVLRKGVYKVSQLTMKTGVTLHLEEGAVLEKVGGESRGTAEGSVLVAAKGVSDFTLMGKGSIAGDIVIENCERVTVRRLGAFPVGAFLRNAQSARAARLILKGSKNIVIEDSPALKLENENSTRLLVDGKLP